MSETTEKPDASLTPESSATVSEAAIIESAGEMTPLEEAWDVAKTVLIAVSITLFIRFFFFQPFNIPSGSMKPTLLVGDFILVDKMEYGYSKASLLYPLTRMPVEGRLFSSLPERGEIIVFKNSNDGNKDYIKRLIGLPGDRVQMISGALHINGERVERVLITDQEPNCDQPSPVARLYQETLPNGVSYTVQECKGNLNPGADNTELFVVPEGHYFLMGDNRDNSADSRTLTVGFVPMDQIVGKATRVAFSVDGQRSRLWEVWNWPMAIRYGRVFDSVD